tara:strand:+ start:5228 stop:5581 length:354 start_codon:yes stop_codon:yes gene_type:complete
MPKSSGGRHPSSRNVSLSTPGGGSVLNHKPNYNLMRVNNIKVHGKAEIQQAEIKSSTKLVVPMVPGGKTFADPATEKGELMFDTSNNKLYISDLSGTGLDGDPKNTFNWIEISTTTV